MEGGVIVIENEPEVQSPRAIDLQIAMEVTPLAGATKADSVNSGLAIMISDTKVEDHTAMPDVISLDVASKLSSEANQQNIIPEIIIHGRAEQSSMTENMTKLVANWSAEDFGLFESSMAEFNAQLAAGGLAVQHFRHTVGRVPRAVKEMYGMDALNVHQRTRLPSDKVLKKITEKLKTLLADASTAHRLATEDMAADGTQAQTFDERKE